MEYKLSHRLREVSGFVPKGARLLDVGSDHAYLPIYLLEKKKIAFAIAGEVVEGPYQSALANVRSAGFESQIAVRLADGLDAFEVSDAISVITICGMGGRLIADILEAGQEKLSAVPCFILQPNNNEDFLRKWLMDNHLKIVAEKIMCDKGKYYEMMLVQHGDCQLTAEDLRFGPILRQEKSAIFVAKWVKELGKLEQALSKIPENHGLERSAIFQKINAIKEIIKNES